MAALGRLALLFDNLKRRAFGPPLPNRPRALAVVADNSFGTREINQFLACEVLP